MSYPGFTPSFRGSKLNPPGAIQKREIITARPYPFLTYPTGPYLYDFRSGLGWGWSQISKQREVAWILKHKLPNRCRHVEERANKFEKLEDVLKVCSLTLPIHPPPYGHTTEVNSEDSKGAQVMRILCSTTPLPNFFLAYLQAGKVCSHSIKSYHSGNFILNLYHIRENLT